MTIVVGRGTRIGSYAGAATVVDGGEVIVVVGDGRGTRDGIVTGSDIGCFNDSGERSMWRIDSVVFVVTALGVLVSGGRGIERVGRFRLSVAVEAGGAVIAGAPGVIPRDGRAISVEAVDGVAGCAGGVILVTTGRLKAALGGAAVSCAGPTRLSRVGRAGMVLTTEAPVSACEETGITAARVGRDPANVAFDTAVIACGVCMLTY